MNDKTPLVPAVDLSSARRRQTGWSKLLSAGFIAGIVLFVLVVGTAALAFFSMEAY